MLLPPYVKLKLVINTDFFSLTLFVCLFLNKALLTFHVKKISIITFHHQHDEMYKNNYCGV